MRREREAMQAEVFRAFLSCDETLNPSQAKELIAGIGTADVVKDKKRNYYNIPCAFDIETSSFYDHGSKAATMYIWMLGINGKVMLGRTWSEWCNVMHQISNSLGLSPALRLPIYVHNLAYEFQFIRKLCEWEDVFSLDVRKPIRALTTEGVEYRCSLQLSGYSLAKLGDELRDYNVHKMVGDLDYELLRGNTTPLNDRELGYCVNDVKVVMAYIAERMSEDGDISKIPMTKTGYVRRYCRNSCFGGRSNYKRYEYTQLMQQLTIEPAEYVQLKRAFQGGFTHANPFHSGKTVEDVTSYDFTSSYPAVIVSERFPMSKGERHTITSREDFNICVKDYCCMFDVEVFGLEPALWYENPLSISRCWDIHTVVSNNGRVVSAEHLKTTMTEQDWIVFKKFYRWDKILVGNMVRYRKGYLPTDLIKAVLKLYKDKTELKGVGGMELEYMRSKQMLNSSYGMMVTDIVRPEITYSSDWDDVELPDLKQALEDYNTNHNRFLFYPWGVWVTAYARRNLFTGVYEFGDDYIYSDTDSIKVINTSDHMDYIERYNQLMREQLYRAMDYHGIDRCAVEPLTKDGIPKLMGVWDFDGAYEQFKTLGAKRYLVRYSDDERTRAKDRGKLSLTVSGVNKSRAVPYLCAQQRDPFENFNNSLYIPADFTGKMTHTYIDEPINGKFTDYTGKEQHYSELTAVHLEKVDYSMDMSREYADYLAGIQYMGLDHV
jgi:hypothetical protein